MGGEGATFTEAERKCRMRAGWWEVGLGADSLEGTATGPSGEATRLLGTQPGRSLGVKSRNKVQPAPPGPGAELQGEGAGRREELSCQRQAKQKKHLWNNLPPAYKQEVCCNIQSIFSKISFSTQYLPQTTSNPNTATQGLLISPFLEGARQKGE